MNARRDALLRRRAELIACCDAQRAALGACVGALGAPLRAADGGLALTRFVRRHPLLVGAASTLVLVTQRRRLWRLAVFAFAAWRSVRGLNSAPRQGPLLDWLQRGAGLWRVWRWLRAAPARP